MNKYDDIINLPHYEPKNHKRMTLESRAAQFAPFAALTGYSDAIIETARPTINEITLDEDSNNILDEKIHIIENNLLNLPIVTINYFIPDEKKEGGKYIEYKGIIKKVDSVNREIVFDNNKKIKIDRIINIKIEIK